MSNSAVCFDLTKHFDSFFLFLSNNAGLLLFDWLFVISQKKKLKDKKKIDTTQILANFST